MSRASRVTGSARDVADPSVLRRVRRLGDGLVLRQPRSRGELFDLLRLRHHAYRKTALQPLESGESASVDAWDPFSFHYGVFKPGPAGERPVGAVRLVPSRTDIVRRRLPQGAVDARRWLEATPVPGTVLPFAAYWHSDVAAAEAVERATRCGSPPIEVTRMCLSESVRSMHAVLGLMAAIGRIAIDDLGRPGTVISVLRHHEPFYRRCGFVRVDRGPTPCGAASLLLCDARRFRIPKLAGARVREGFAAA